MTEIVGLAILFVLAGLNALRWLRVAQREHYLPGSVTRFALRWRWVGVGLSLHGRTSKLAWTRRLRVLAGFTTVLMLLPMLFGIAGGLVDLVLTPLFVDLALLITKPIEDWLVRPFVKQAQAKLAAISPTIVGITGSYGKTSTKVVLAHLVQGTRAVAASPASFNNRAGLARAVNEGLAPGTDVFVAEMGTYGRGEIADLCRWCPPDIAIITAIGPVHLERFGSEDVTLAAKAEITATATTVVLNIDDPRLSEFADRLAGKNVVRVSAVRRDADVAVVDGLVFVRGEQIGFVESLPTAPTNVACATAVALELGVRRDDVIARLRTAPTASNRLEVTTAPSGLVVLDDTFNSNPAGARRALDALGRAATGRKVLITPGMIELGKRQASENEAFARDAGAVSTDIAIVGRTNATALRRGAAATDAAIHAFRNRDEAVAWVRANLGSGDAVLYENDLPDHYN